MENLFDVILDKDEQILKLYKPHKLGTWFGGILSIIFMSIVLVPFAVFCFLDTVSIATGVTILAFLLVWALIIIICNALWLNKTVYAVTNKRIIIRTGYIGVDYKSLDYTMLGALTVNVSLIDKLIRKNTGSIAFGSMASPMTNATQAKFNFAYITNPYETYKEIKNIIDEHK